MKEIIKLIKEVKHHHKNPSQSLKNLIRKVKFQAPPWAVLKQVQWLQNLSIKFKEMMMTNGPLSLNLTLNFLKNKNNLKEWESKNSRRKLKKNLTNKWRKKEERKNVNKNNKKSITNYNKSKPNSTIKDKEKKERNIKEKLNSKRKCVIDKLKINLKERK